MFNSFCKIEHLEFVMLYNHCNSIAINNNPIYNMTSIYYAKIASQVYKIISVTVNKINLGARTHRLGIH